MIRWRTYYTPGTPYEQEAQELVANMAKHGITVSAIPYQQQHDWMRTCMARSILLHEEMELNIANAASDPDAARDWLGLMDADLIIKEPPTLLKDPPEGYDVMCHDAGGAVAFGRRFPAGIAAFAPTIQGRKALGEWARQCKDDQLQHMNLREQIFLQGALTECSQPKIFKLPASYHCIPYGETWKTAVVVHSRDKDLKRCILEGIPLPRPMPNNDPLPRKPKEAPVQAPGGPPPAHPRELKSRDGGVSDEQAALKFKADMDAMRRKQLEDEAKIGVVSQPPQQPAPDPDPTHVTGAVIHPELMADATVTMNDTVPNVIGQKPVNATERSWTNDPILDGQAAMAQPEPAKKKGKRKGQHEQQRT
jgi:hypothetical protein